MLKKLRFQLVFITMTIITVMLGIIFGLIYYFTSANLKAESLQMMRRAMLEPIRSDRSEEPKDELSLLYFTVHISKDGETVVSENHFFDLSDPDLLEVLTSRVLASDEQYGSLQDNKLRFLKHTTPRGVLLVFADTSTENLVLSNLTKSCTAIGVLCLVLFFGISILLAQWMVKPVEKAWAQQKQFVADASHELKTPLTVILTNAELLQNSSCDEPSRKQFSDSILTMSHQMRGLVEGLLNLARVDSGAAQVHFAPLNFSQLTEDSLLPFEPLYFESGLGLSTKIEPNIFLKGSAAHLRQVLEILLDNAWKYASPNGTVTIGLQRHGHCCIFSVSNPGDEISGPDLKNIFKRFYRVDKARSMNHSYGLGLPIAQGIVENHRGKIWAESNHGINTFCVQLPIISRNSEDG